MNKGITRYSEELYDSGLAGVYDHLMQSVDYRAWCDYIEEIIHRYRIRNGRLLDLACGTGNSVFPFAEKGYPVVGVDCSRQMIELARQKAGTNFPKVDFVVEDLRSLAMEDRFSLAVLYQDGFNYLLTVSDLEKALRRVCQLLEEGGYLVFDLNFPLFFSRQEKEVSWVEEEEFTMAWESSYDFLRREREITLLVFIKRKDGAYSKYREVHREKEFSREEVSGALERAGFSLREVLPTLEWRSPSSREPRLTFIAQKNCKTDL